MPTLEPPAGFHTDPTPDVVNHHGDPFDEAPHANVRAWTVVGDTWHGNYDAVFGTSVVTARITGDELATVNVFVSPHDGAIVVDVVDVPIGVPLRVNVNDFPVFDDVID